MVTARSEMVQFCSLAHVHGATMSQLDITSASHRTLLRSPLDKMCFLFHVETLFPSEF